MGNNQIAYNYDGKTLATNPSDCTTSPKGRLSIIDSTPMTNDTRGLYYQDDSGKDVLVAKDHWHRNYGLTLDGSVVVN